MSRGRTYALLALAALLAGLLAAAAAHSVRWVRHAWLPPSGPIVYIPKTIDPNIEFWQVARQGVDAAAKELGVPVTVLGTAREKDIDGQIELVESAVGLHPRAIVLAANDYERLVPAARKVKNAGIPLIMVDSGINGRFADSLIATDNFEAGRQVGDALRRLVPAGSRVAVINYIQASANAQERENGVLSSLAEGDIAVEPTLYSDGLDDKAYELTRELLLRRPDLAGIAALNEPTADGAARAIEEAGAQGRVKLVGIDSSTSEIDYLEREVLQVIVVQKPFNMGYLAIKTAERASRGRKVEPLIRTGSAVITKADMYSRENQKLLFPFLSGQRDAGGGPAAGAVLSGEEPGEDRPYAGREAAGG